MGLPPEPSGVSERTFTSETPQLFANVACHGVAIQRLSNDTPDMPSTDGPFNIDGKLLSAMSNRSGPRHKRHVGCTLRIRNLLELKLLYITKMNLVRRSMLPSTYPGKTMTLMSRFTRVPEQVQCHYGNLVIVPSVFQGSETLPEWKEPPKLYCGPLAVFSVD